MSNKIKFISNQIEPKIPKVAIIILNWNRPKMTLTCVRKLLNIDFPNFQIFLVDNGSGDNSCQLFKKNFGSNLKIILICQRKNLGFAGGNNLAIKQVLKQGFDFILLVNNDTDFKKDFLTKLVDAAMAIPEVGAVVPKVYYFNKKKLIQSAGGQLVWRRGEARLIGNLEKDQGQLDSFRQTDYAPGVCALIPREVFKKVGLIPEEYFMYFEDVDWSLKIRQKRYKLIYVPSAAIFHHDSLSAGTDSPAKIYYYVRNTLILVRKWRRWYFWFLFIPCFGFKLAKIKIKYLWQRKFANIWAILFGIINFLRGESGESKRYRFSNHRKL